jgi:hypothetical protein
MTKIEMHEFSFRSNLIQKSKLIYRKKVLKNLTKKQDNSAK